MKGLFEQAIQTGFEGLDVDHDQQVEAGHHRREIRKLWIMPVSQLGGLYQQSQWAGLQSVLMVYRRRYLWNKVTEETQFFLTSFVVLDNALVERFDCIGGLKINFIGFWM